MSEQPLVLIDGSSYLYRAFHALPPLTNSKGSPTGAVYGVANMLRKLQKDYPTNQFVVVFDPKGKTFRHDMYTEYKANRAKMPDELICQVQPLFELIEAMGFPLVVIDGVEADDVIGTLAQQAASQGINTVISSSDKDLAQLVNQKISLVNTMSGTTLDVDGVKNKFGVSPEQIIDYLALMGDTSDNIPGVPKVGPKTAVKWLEEYKNLDNLIKHADEITGKVGENLRNNLQQLALSKELVTIKCDVKLPNKFTDLSIKTVDKQRLKQVLMNLEFKSWLAELEGEPHQGKQPKKYTIIVDEKLFLDWVDKLKKASLICFDTETTSLDYIQAELVGASFSIKADEGIYIPFGHDYMGVTEQLDRTMVLSVLKPILEDEKIKKIGQNIKYDMSVLKNYDITLRGIAFDTMIESFVWSSTGRHDMDSMALKYLNYQTIHFEDIAGKGAKQLTFNQVPIEQAGPYAAEDADITLQLHQYFWPRICKEQSLQFVFEKIEMPLIPILSRMERHGVLIDVKLLNEQSKFLAKRIKEIEEQAYKVAGEMFNLGSPKQLQEILYEKLSLPILQKTPKGQPSTAEDVLQELAENYQLPKLILEFRSLSKLKSTYTDRLPESVNPKTGRVHASFNQTGAATGRFSSSDPNLQNIPVRTEEGRRIRQAFIAPENYKIIAADYAQIELKIMAHLSGDEGLLKAFAQGLDIHKATAAEVFNIRLEDVTSLQRRSAKAINFGLIYGMSAFGLAKQLDIDRQEAQHYVDCYFAKYPRVKAFMEEIRKKAHKQGYVETLFGRRLYLDEINSRNKTRQNAAERTAVNAPMQGTAADLIKQAMITADQLLTENKIRGHMIMQVHDELVFEIHQDDCKKAMLLIEKAMDSVVELKVPLTVSIGLGDNWDEAH